ncbi:MAG: hypothetical protein ABSG63_14190 [Spirochaetia bacterium]|jgi:hypothetical protein
MKITIDGDGRMHRGSIEELRARQDSADTPVTHREALDIGLDRFAPDYQLQLAIRKASAGVTLDGDHADDGKSLAELRVESQRRREAMVDRIKAESRAPTGTRLDNVADAVAEALSGGRKG